MSRDLIDNVAAAANWTSLEKVFQRAKQFYGKGAKRAIEDHLRGGGIRAQALELKVFEAEDTFEFSNDSVPPHFKSGEWQAREEAAHRWAFDRHPVPIDGSVHVWKGERVIFVYTCIAIAHERRGAIIPFGEHIEVVLKPETNRVVVHEYLIQDGRRWPDTRYRSDGGYHRYEATGVRCLQTDVDAAFPYSDEYRSRRKQARPVEYPIEEAVVFLRSYYEGQAAPEKQADVIRVLGDWYATQGRAPSASTLRDRAKRFMAVPQ